MPEKLCDFPFSISEATSPGMKDSPPPYKLQYKARRQLSWGNEP